MDERAELSISKLPRFLQPPARELWKVKADSLQEIALSNLVIGASTVAGLSAGAFAVSSMPSNEENEQVQMEKVVSQSTNEAYSETANTEEESEQEEDDSQQSSCTKVPRGPTRRVDKVGFTKIELDGLEVEVGFHKGPGVRFPANAETLNFVLELLDNKYAVLLASGRHTRESDQTKACLLYTSDAADE